MNRVAGFTILLGVLVLGIGVSETLNDAEDAGSIALFGVTLIGAGFFLNRRRGGRAAGTAAGSEARFSIVQTGDDAVVSAVARLLEGHAQITAVVPDTGRWHETPDRDDLPEWHALRIYCAPGSRDEVIAMVTDLIRERLGEAALNEVSIRRG